MMSTSVKSTQYKRKTFNEGRNKRRKRRERERESNRSFFKQIRGILLKEEKNDRVNTT
jgi:hypothetical protein